MQEEGECFICSPNSPWVSMIFQQFLNRYFIRHWTEAGEKFYIATMNFRVFSSKIDKIQLFLSYRHFLNPSFSSAKERCK